MENSQYFISFFFFFCIKGIKAYDETQNVELARPIFKALVPVCGTQYIFR